MVDSLQELMDWRTSAERNAAWKPPAVKKDAINPTHYQSLMAIPNDGIIIELQWLEHLQYHAHYREPSAFKAAVEMQVRKYLDRCGGKDAELQELKKALWYLKFLAAYVANNNKPIYVKYIEELLKNA